MSFFNTTHCTSGAHCKVCRAFYAGRAWRASIALKFNLASVNFNCPSGREWIMDDVPLPSTLQSRLTRALQVCDTSPAARLLRAYAQQICDVARGSRSGVCGMPSAFIRRLQAKLDYYWDDYIRHQNSNSERVKLNMEVS